MEIQVFGTHKSRDTRAALRFFSERRVKTHFVDLRERPASRGELTRFAQRFGVAALVDRCSRRYQELGLGSGLYTDEAWIQKLADEPLLLRQPLTRSGQKLAIGTAEKEWQSWITQRR